MRVINGYVPIKTGAISNGVKRILVGNLIIVSSIVLVSGCGSKRPLPETVDAQIAIQQAKKAGAEEYAPNRLWSAQDYLTRASGARKKKEAKELAREAEVDACIAEYKAKRIKEEEKRRAEEADKKRSLAHRKVERAIARAQQAINQAAAENKEIKVAQNRLQQAREAFKKKRLKEAKQIAQEARILAQEARILAPEAKVKLPEYHEVKRGETLKIIAQEVYGDLEKWVLIYRANRSKIDNANIIQPGQILSIPRE